VSTTGSLTCPLDNCLAVCSRESQSVWAILNEKKKKKYVVIDEIFYFVIFELSSFHFDVFTWAICCLLSYQKC
jgi:hypothetical protein